MVTKTSIGGPVLLDELAGRLSGSIEGATYWVGQVGGKIDQDWAGRSIVSPATARKALAAFHDRAAEEAALQSEYDAYLRQRQQELHTVGEEAFQRAGAAEFKREHQVLRDSETHWVGLPGTISPQGRQVARRAANEARERFEREHPLLTFEQWKERKR